MLLVTVTRMPLHPLAINEIFWPSSKKTARAAYHLCLKRCRVRSLSNPDLLPNPVSRASLAGCFLVLVVVSVVPWVSLARSHPPQAPLPMPPWPNAMTWMDLTLGQKLQEKGVKGEGGS